MAFVDKNLRTEPLLSDNNYLDIFTPIVSEEFESQLREGYERLFLGKKLLLRLGIGKWHIGDYAMPKYIFRNLIRFIYQVTTIAGTWGRYIYENQCEV